MTMMKRIPLLIFMLIIAFGAAAQTSLEGKVTDAESGEPIIFGSVALYKNGVLVTGKETDIDGNYSFSNIDPGQYDVEFTYVGYQTQRQTGVLVGQGRANRLDVQLGSGVDLEEVVVVDYEVPLVQQDETTVGGTVTGENIKNMPLKNINAIAATAAGVSSQDGGEINIGGARSSGTVYYLDGMRVTGRTVPQTEIEQMQVLTGGIPASYGDVTGGAISITTKGPTSKFSGGFEAETSQFLDPYGYNLLYGNLSGPIIKDSTGRSILGFRLSSQYRRRADPNPPALGVYGATEESIRELEENPLTQIPGSQIASGEFYRDERSGGPVQELDRRPNNNEEQLDITAKLDWRINDAIDVQFTGTFFDGTRRFTPGRFNAAGGRADWSVFNYTRNPYVYNDRYRGIMRFRHRLGKQSYSRGNGDEGPKNPVIQNAVYTIEAGYQYSSQQNEDLIHQERLFDYGYIGEFNIDYIDDAGLVSRDHPGAVAVVGEDPDNPNVTIDTFFGHTFYQESLNLENPYTPGSQNPVLNNYNKLVTNPSQLQDFINYNGFTSGVFDNIWNIFSNVGSVYNQVRQSENEIYTFQVNSSFDFMPGGSEKGRHNIQFGIFWEQRINRVHQVSPRNLWLQARLLTNAHITGVNTDNPIHTWNGGTDYDFETFDQEIIGETFTFQKYEYAFEDPGNTRPFWRNIRDRLGMEYYEPLNIDGVDPSLMSLDLFSVRELTDVNYVGYFGYDYLGNRTSRDVTFDDFFSGVDEEGNRTFLVAPYRPIYFSAYLQDKFTYKDIIFRLGVRVDRFDANTRVLKDPFALYDIQTADEFYEQRPDFERPANVADDFKVYVQSPEDDRVVGFRRDEVWFDANGTQLNDGTELFQGGVVTPAYVEEDPDIKSEDFDPTTAFEDYEPQWTVMPRLAFSFPISDEANFFAHYDILAQRPNAGQGYVSPLQYFYFEDAGRQSANNPNLRPVKTINYEVGFRKRVSNSSAITISAFYREMRDLIQIRTLLNVANPIGQYEVFDNLDFGTVKEFKFQYDLRRTGNLQVRGIYRLQFADGTGSAADSQRGITDRGNLRTLFPLDYDERHRFVANIDYRYSSGKRYTGPKWFDKDIFANAGVNIQASAVSGRPYTPALAPDRFGATGFAGGFNSARQPWTFTIDMRVDKNWTISGPESKRPVNLNVYFRAENLLDARNVTNVYRATGDPRNDGFLNFRAGEATIRNLAETREGIDANEQVFMEAYQWAMLNPGFFVRPRRMFVGAIVEF